MSQSPTTETANRLRLASNNPTPTNNTTRLPSPLEPSLTRRTASAVNNPTTRNSSLRGSSSRRASYLSRVGGHLLSRNSTAENTDAIDDDRQEGRAVRRRLASGSRAPTTAERTSVYDTRRTSRVETAPQISNETDQSRFGHTSTGSAEQNTSTIQDAVVPSTTSNPTSDVAEVSGGTSGIGRRRSRLSSIRNSLANLPFSRYVPSTDRASSPDILSEIDSPQPGVSETEETMDRPVSEASSPSTRPARPTSLAVGSAPSYREYRRGLAAYERGLRRISNARRGGTPRPGHGEDQAAWLSRLLSHAAALTAVSLVGNNENALYDAHDVGGDGGDGSFQNFLQTLENGRLAAALRNGNGVNGSSGGGDDQAVNFFRMFRFGATLSQTRSSTTSPPPPSEDSPDQEENGPMVPVIIVGIRSMTAEEGVEREVGTAATPPFFDMLQNLATEEEPRNRTGGLLRRTDGTSRFGRMRSTFSQNQLPGGSEALRNARALASSASSRTNNVLGAVDSLASGPTVLSESPPGPHPPPSTPADPSLSALSSGTTTPVRQPSSASNQILSGSPSSGEPYLRRPGVNVTGNGESGAAASRGVRRRRMSDSEFGRTGDLGSGSSRRNGIVGGLGAANDSNDSEGTAGRRGNRGDSAHRSWIIYVLGGSYPEDHPILTTPSLFTDSPSYEDMLLLATLLGPAKPPVASEDDVASAAGLYRVTSQDDGRLIAIAVDDDGENLRLEQLERCLVCLCDYMNEDELRKLDSCGHFFHRECIDQWLTTGRNSCPLCRGQGVEENKAANEETTAAPEEEATIAGVGETV
ncbi:MAG: hypothetical protein M1814_001645 [Vezdaea aestivalis]|nr:MAG: hypothetical protein M1814_001645 [Vezdaea aestivalis]